MSKYTPKHAGYVRTDARNKTAERMYPVRLHIDGEKAVAQDLVSVLEATALTAETQSIVEGITNPTVPRNLRIKGNAAGVAGDVVITGTNYNGDEISETITLNGSTTVDGNKAFKTITQVDLPVEVNVGTDTVSIGVGNKLGLPYKLAHNTVLKAYRNNTLEGTMPTVTTSTTELESNTVTLNSALNGTDIDIYLLV